MVDLKNPAARLEAFLRTLVPQRGSPQAVYQVLCNMWDLDDESGRDQMVLLQRVGEVVDLGVQVRERAERVPRYGPMMLKNFDQVETTLFNLGGLLRSHRTEQILEPMAATAWTSLEQLRELLDDEHPLVLEDGAVDTLLQQISELIARVHADSALDDVERSTILEHLLAVQATLLNVDVVGPEKVERATDGLMGALIRLSFRSRAFAEHPVADMSFRLVGAIGLALSIAADWQSLSAGGFAAMLALGSGGSAGGTGGGGTLGSAG